MALPPFEGLPSATDKREFSNSNLKKEIRAVNTSPGEFKAFRFEFSRVKYMSDLNEELLRFLLWTRS